MNKSISKIILSLMIIFFLTLSFSCSNPSSDNSTESGSTNTQSPSQPNPTSPPSPNNPPAPTPAPEVYYTISFNKNNDAATGSTASIKAKADSIVTLTANGFALEGYTFTGWNTKADGTGTGYGDASSLKLTSDTTLYAQWISDAAPTYQISIPAVVGGTVSVNKTVAEAGSEIVLTIIPDDLYEVDACVVTDSENNSIQVTKNQSNNYTFIMPGKNVTVDAKFIYVAHTVSIVPGENGIASVNKINAVAGNEVTITVQPDENYVLNTISVKETSGASIDIIQSQKNPNIYTFSMPDKDVVVSVTYKERSYTVRFITDCSIQIPSQTVERNGKAKYVSISDNSECSGFLGWYIEPECINKFDFDNSAIIQDVALYAKWEKFISEKNKSADRIKNLHYSCKIETIGDADSIREVNQAFKDLYERNNEIRVELIIQVEELESAGSTNSNNSFYKCKNLSKIVLVDCVKIGDYAFAECTNLTDISFGDSISVIGKYALENCSSITNLVIPDTVTLIDKGALKGCSKIRELSIPFVGRDANSYDADYETCCLGYIFEPSYKSISSGDFTYNCNVPSSIKKVVISGSKKIPKYAFSRCMNIQEIVLPEDLEVIGRFAFNECNSWKYRTIPSSVSIIEDCAFASTQSYPEVKMLIYFDDTESSWKVQKNGSNSLPWTNVGPMNKDPTVNAKKICHTYDIYRWKKIE